MRMIEYWRNSLSDADRLNPDFEKLRSGGLQIELEAFVQGEVPSEMVDQFLAKLSEKDKKKEVYDVLICPIVLYVKTVHASSVLSQLPSSLSPLWIPAMISKKGLLQPHPRYIPWISREYLEPIESDVDSIGAVKDVDSFLSSRSVRIEKWTEYINFVYELLSTVTGMSVDDFHHPQFERSNESYLFSNDLIAGTSKSIQDLYGHIQRDYSEKQGFELLNTFAKGLESAEEPLNAGETHEILAIRHLGQMSNQFSLSASQRTAFHHTTLLNTGDLLAVNGPPGTGKTTLLQSIVATAVIEHALQQAEPPVIVVSSTNNNAVTNVIESFGKINESDGNPLKGRWIKGLDSYASYLRSNFNKESAAPGWLNVYKDYQGGDGFFKKMETADYLANCAKEYLSYCSEFMGYPICDVEQAIQSLHNKLQNKVQHIRNIVQTEENRKILQARLQQKYPLGLQATATKLNEAQQRAKEQEQACQVLQKSWNQFCLEENWWIDIVARIPVFKQIAFRKRELRCQQFCLDHDILVSNSGDELEKRMRQKKMQATQAMNACEAQIKELRADQQEWQDIRQRWGGYLAELSVDASENYLDVLDRTLRYDAFKLATHYWEGRWILETKGMLIDREYKRNNGTKGNELLWRRLAKLTPCFVSTLYMVPTFFSAYMGKHVPLYDFIDILIIDEAGQVVPEVAGASFALAKKAIIVGDTLQIPPVWKIPAFVDMGNALKFKLTANIGGYEELSETGVLASDGSVMTMAKKLSKFTDSALSGGLWLTEHRRCVPEIISYCNKLAYHGKLVPKRPSIPNYFLPHMGYAHIPGNAQKRGGSFANELEAEIIVSWIVRNQDQILNYYRKDGIIDIKDIIAVVTPFNAQKRLLIEKLRKAGLKGIKAGTVHTLQGDERPIVIFSPVYHSGSSNSFFYDRDVSMLNVAVSRARDSFLVFGDMGTFMPNTMTPSGILADYLFDSEENEIKNIDLEGYYKTRYGSPVEHLHELEHHRRMLKSCIESADQELHIVSPYLSSVAIEADKLELLFGEAIQRGVNIYVYTDEALNFSNGYLKTNYVKAKELLSQLGINVFLMKGVHSKALWVDSAVLVEGSFNWLSAIRQSDSLWCRYETSLVYRGEEVGNMIVKLKEDLKKRKINQGA